MNHLSWLLYWADTLPSLGTRIGFISVLAGIPVIIIACFHFGLKISEDKDYDNGLSFAPRWLAGCVATFLLTSFIPSQNTLYLIAASQAGEQVTQTPEFSKIRQIVNKYLDTEIAGNSSEKETPK